MRPETEDLSVVAILRYSVGAPQTTMPTVKGYAAFFFILSPPPPRSTLFPYTTLFRSCSLAIESVFREAGFPEGTFQSLLDRKSTRLNSSHSQISYAVFCLKKKKSSLKYDIP